MIQPTTENKYRFNMQVSARAMGYRNRTLPHPTTARRDRFSDVQPMDRASGRELPTEADGRIQLPLFRKLITDP
jgi:hypothetical protein